MLKHMPPGAVPQTGTSLGANHNSSYAANSSNSTVNDNGSIIIGASTSAPAVHQQQQQQQHVINAINPSSVAAAAAQQHLQPLNVSTHTIRSSPHSILGAFAATTTSASGQGPNKQQQHQHQQQQQLLQLVNGNGPPRCGSLAHNPQQQHQLQPTQQSQHTPLTSLSSSLVMSSQSFHPSQQPSQHHSCMTAASMTKHRVGAREALTSLGLLCLGEYCQLH